MKKTLIAAAVLSAMSAANAAVLAQLDNAEGETAARIVTEVIDLRAAADGLSATPGAGKSANVVIAGSDIRAPAIASYTWSSGPQTFAFQGGDTSVVVSSAIGDAFTMSGLPSARPIKNAPYSAEIINERIQMLPDGNQIVKRRSQLSFRDSAGRTRIDTRSDSGETTSVMIADNVEGSRLLLSPKGRVATKMNVDRNFQKRIDEIRETARAMAKDGKATVIERSPGEEVIIKRSEGKRADGRAESREEMSIRVVRVDTNANVSARQRGDNSHVLISGDDQLRLLAPRSAVTELPLGELVGNSAVGAAFQDRAWSAKATTKELGTRDFDGVRAEGKMRAYTIPAGEVGNKNPITVTTETWTSPDLRITVYSKHSDPRSGETIYRLANLKRSEQPMALFSVPDDYQVREMPAMPPLPPTPPTPPAPPRP